jgi:hypothetical protein
MSVIGIHIGMYTSFLYVPVCLYVRRVYMRTGWYVFARSTRAENDVQIQNQCNVVMMFLDQNVMLLRMVHLVSCKYNILKMRIDCKHSFGEEFYPFSCTIY